MEEGSARPFIGPFVVTLVASLIAIFQVGLVVGIFLAEYSKKRAFRPLHPPWVNDILPGCRRFICASLCMGHRGDTRVSLVSRHGCRRAWPCDPDCCPPLIKNHERGLRWCPKRSAWGRSEWELPSVRSRASLPQRLHTIRHRCGAWGIARAAGETAPLIFTALFYPSGLKGVLQSGSPRCGY